MTATYRVLPGAGLWLSSGQPWLTGEGIKAPGGERLTHVTPWAVDGAASATSLCYSEAFLVLNVFLSSWDKRIWL